MADMHKNPPLVPAMAYLLFILLLGILRLQFIVAQEQPSVFYIETQYLKFFMAPNLTFSSENATHILSGLSSCQCQSACIAQGSSCQAWSSVPSAENGAVFECRLINHGPETTTVYQAENATYYFRQESISGQYSWQADNLLYVELESKYHYEEAKERCAKIPGHRLVIIKKQETYDFMKALSGKNGAVSWLLDLRKITDTQFVWGDERIFNNEIEVVIDEPVSSDYFVFVHSQVHDENTRLGPFLILCQANPLGIDW